MPLVLTRQTGDSLYLILEDDSQIVIKLEERNQNQIKLAIDAPKSVQVLRGELLEGSN